MMIRLLEKTLKSDEVCRFIEDTYKGALGTWKD